MNKVTGFHIWHVILVSIALLILAGCGVMAPSVLPASKLSTGTPPYIHYTPPEQLNIHLEFDYPGTWVFSEEMREAGIAVIGFSDPRFRTLPTPSSEFLHPAHNDFGRMAIWVFPIESGQTVDTEAETFKQENSGNTLVKFQDDYKIKIDGYDARILEYQINDPESYASVMFERNTIFVVENQVYKIFLTIAEKDRGGEFEKGYEYFFNSLEIIR